MNTSNQPGAPTAGAPIFQGAGQAVSSFARKPGLPVRFRAPGAALAKVLPAGTRMARPGFSPEFGHTALPGVLPVTEEPGFPGIQKMRAAQGATMSSVRPDGCAAGHDSRGRLNRSRNCISGFLTGSSNDNRSPDSACRAGGRVQSDPALPSIRKASLLHGNAPAPCRGSPDARLQSDRAGRQQLPVRPGRRGFVLRRSPGTH